MIEVKAQPTRPRIGQYVVTRELQTGHNGPRSLALHELDHSSHVLHRPHCGPWRFDQRRFLAAAARLEATPSSHILAIEDYGLDAAGHPWIITPFTGDARGVVTLADHVRQKGGYLAPGEAREAVVHLLQAAAEAHSAGLVHGPMTMEHVLVDRRGSLLVELYGLSVTMGHGVDDPVAMQSREVGSIVRIGYQLVTGLLPESPIIPASRVVAGLDAALDDWFQTGLHVGAGFRSAAHALSALTDRVPAEPVARGGVRSVLRRFLFAGA